MIMVKLSEHFPMRVADWLCAGVLLSWGVGVLSVGNDIWGLPPYAGLRRIADREVWGTVALMVGACRLIALFVNGAVRRTPHARALGAFISCFIWLQLSFAMFDTSYPAISIAMYPWFFMGDGYNVYRAAQDARLSDNRARKAQASTSGARPDAAST